MQRPPASFTIGERTISGPTYRQNALLASSL